MQEFQLLNLFAGETRLRGESSDARVGPFAVRLIDDYASAVATMTQSGKVNVSWGPDQTGALSKEVTRTPGVRGEWAVTATATLTEETAEDSILARKPIKDGGLFDLCQLLTFATGRSVTVEEFAERYNPRTKGSSFCPPAGTLPIVARAWHGRTNLVAQGCQYALLTHNRAFNTWALSELGAAYNTALNVLLDHWPCEKLTIAKPIREQLREKVTTAVDSIDALSAEHREAYKGILGGRVMQGPFGLLDQLLNLLVRLGIIGDPPSEDQRRRAQFVNAVRNKLTHSGQIPELKGLTQEQADRYCVTIVGGVVPEVNKLAIGALLGFSADAEPWMQEEREELKTFFSTGVWRNWPLETAEFHDWVSNVDLLELFGASSNENQA